MNHITKLFLAFCFLQISLNAYYYDFQGRVGAYYPTSSQSKAAFKKGIPVYEIETSIHFMQPWEWMPWKAWANASYMTGTGWADHLGRTGSNMTTISLGLKHSWMLDCYWGTFYLGAGPSLSWLRIKTHSIVPEGFWDGRWHGHRKISKKNFGAVIKSGFQMIVYGWLVDVFADYHILAFHYKNLSKKHLFPRVTAVNRIYKYNRKDGHHRLDLGGFVIGGAIGASF